MQIDLWKIKNSNKQLRAEMADHYSQPRGFVGRNICYSVFCNGIRYGSIVAGSAVLNLKSRDIYFDVAKLDKKAFLLGCVNNIFYHIAKIDNRYPMHNFAAKVLLQFEIDIQKDWYNKYENPVVALESLVELPRTGELYLRAGWTEVGITKGFTCKRIPGKLGYGSDNWSGQRVWNTTCRRPKRIFVKRVASAK